MKRYLHIALGVTVFVVCCNSPSKGPDSRVVEVDELYSVEIPHGLTPSYDMHDYAGLQYSDPEHSLYIIGIFDNKADLGDITRQRLKLDGYYKFVEKTVLTYADSVIHDGSTKFSLENNLQGQTGDYEVMSKQNGKSFHLFYQIVVFESENYFFQFVIWMPYENHSTYSDQINEFIYSFQLIED